MLSLQDRQRSRQLSSVTNVEHKRICVGGRRRSITSEFGARDRDNRYPGRSQEFLGARRGAVVSAVCGGDVVSVDPLLHGEIDLGALSDRLAAVARVRRGPSIIVAEVDPYTITVFRDGRALIRGARDETTARSVYARFVGR